MASLAEMFKEVDEALALGANELVPECKCEACTARTTLRRIAEVWPAPARKGAFVDDTERRTILEALDGKR